MYSWHFKTFSLFFLSPSLPLSLSGFVSDCYNENQYLGLVVETETSFDFHSGFEWIKCDILSVLDWFTQGRGRGRGRVGGGGSSIIASSRLLQCSSFSPSLPPSLPLSFLLSFLPLSIASSGFRSSRPLVLFFLPSLLHLFLRDQSRFPRFLYIFFGLNQ